MKLISQTDGLCGGAVGDMLIQIQSVDKHFKVVFTTGVLTLFEGLYTTEVAVIVTTDLYKK
jgi:hypothetical protein